jgi:hypothetical protein
MAAVIKHFLYTANCIQDEDNTLEIYLIWLQTTCSFCKLPQKQKRKKERIHGTVDSCLIDRAYSWLLSSNTSFLDTANCIQDEGILVVNVRTNIYCWSFQSEG